MYDYRVVSVEKVVDGDTLDVTIDVGFRMTTTQRLRLQDIDTPERGQPGWAEAKGFVEQWVRQHAGHMTVRTRKSDVFGRYLAYLDTGRQPNTLNQDLIDAQLATWWGR